MTGASRGIGRACALDLASRGAAVACASRDLELARATAAAVESAGGTAEAMPVDVRDEESVRALADAVAARFGRVDALVNNAGVAVAEQFPGLARERWDDVLATNVTGPFLCTRELLPHLAGSTRGAVVNVGSINGIVSMKGLASYCASKGGLHHLTRQLALELADRGVRVNCVAPGFVASDMFETSHSPERREWIARLHPLGRVGRAEEVAAVVSFLCSDLASFVTGAIVTVDGGLTTQFGLDVGP